MNNLKLFSYGVFIVMISLVSFNQASELIVKVKSGYKQEPITCLFKWSGAGMDLPIDTPKPKPEIRGFDVSNIVKGLD